MFSLRTRADRVRKMLELTRTDACVVKSFENRRYLTDLPTSAGLVVVTKMGNCYVIVDDRYEEVARKELAWQGFIIRVVLNKHNYMDVMNDIVQSDKISTMLIESDIISHEEYLDFERAMYAKVMPLKSQLAKIRACKDLKELESTKTAQRISEKTFDELLEYIKPGMSERQVQTKIVQSLLENGSDLDKFHICCVSGSNSSMVHGRATDKIIEKGDPLLLDFGATYNGYKCSMSRTICVGKPTEDFVNAYNVVKNANLLGAKYIKNGISGKSADEQIRSYIEQMGYGPNFLHASAHGIGLKYNELPAVSPSSKDTLSVGNIIAMEPGVYFKGKFGVRIGDLFYIGEKYTENLTRSPKELIIL